LTATQSPLIGTTDQVVTAFIDGLVGGQEYHFRVIAGSVAGTTYGADTTFSTDLTVPDIKANGEDSILFVVHGEAVDVAVSLAPGSLVG
jgi:hypothetical protein